MHPLIFGRLRSSHLDHCSSIGIDGILKTIVEEFKDHQLGKLTFVNELEDFLRREQKKLKSLIRSSNE
jgi:hypothetical protein